MIIRKEVLILVLIYTWSEITPSTLSEHLSYRLPDDHVPHKYELTLSLNPDLNQFIGKLTVTLETGTDTNYLLLHASPSRISNVTDIKLDFIHDCDAVYLNHKVEMLNITCGGGEQFGQGEHSLSLNYIGSFGTRDKNGEYVGFYKSSYETQEGPSMYAVTQFEPTYARSAFPCFDEPRFKAEFEITLLHPSNYKVLANTGVSSEKKLGGLVQTKFKKTPLIPTYLIAFLISNFKIVSDNSNSTPTINVYSRPSQSEHTGTAIKNGRKLVEALGNWTGISYEELGIPKLDMVAVPEYLFGAMENWGLITFQEVDLLDEGDKTSAEDKENIISVIAHELAHHWFGDYVTLDWWSNTWLNEGFATYFQYHIPDLVDDLKMELRRQFVPLSLHAAFESDGDEAPPLSSPYEDIKTPVEDLNKFDGISYEKGASIIRMMESILGEENFRDGLKFYLEDNSYNNSSPAKLVEALSQFNNCENNFEEVMKNWIYQSGYPIVTATINKTNNVVTIMQEEFPSNASKQSAKKLWMIPVTFATSQNVSNVTHWMDANTTTLEITLEENAWFIMNLQQKGYYRVNYDEELWKRIISELTSGGMEKIHVSNRAQLLDDAFVLAKIGKINYTTAFELASYLVQESQYEPWYVAAKSLKYIKALLETHGDEEAVNNLKTVVLRWINEAFPIDMKVTSHLDILTRELIYNLKCEMGDSKSLQDSSNILQKYMEKSQIDDHNTRKTALCFGMKYSKNPVKDYNKLLKAYKDSNSALEQRAILQSLGCPNNPEVLRKYLNELLSNDTSISRLDAKFVFRAVTANNHVGLKVILPFLKTNLKKVLERYSGLITLSDLILQPAKWIVSQQQMNQLEDIIESNKDVDGIANIGNKALELPKLYNQWFDSNRKTIDSLLSRMTSSSIVVVPSIFLTVFSLINCIMFLPNILE